MNGGIGVEHGVDDDLQGGGGFAGGEGFVPVDGEFDGLRCCGGERDLGRADEDEEAMADEEEMAGEDAMASGGDGHSNCVLCYKNHHFMAKYGKKAQSKVEKAMHEEKRGQLKSGRSGKKVTSRKQAIAIGLSEARKAGGKVPKKAGSKKAAPKKKAASKKKAAPKKKAATKKKAAPGKKSASRKKAARKR